MAGGRKLVQSCLTHDFVATAKKQRAERKLRKPAQSVRNARYRGEFEQRLKEVLDEVTSRNDTIVPQHRPAHKSTIFH